jgi:hypothetical protein
MHTIGKAFLVFTLFGIIGCVIYTAWAFHPWSWVVMGMSIVGCFLAAYDEAVRGEVVQR